MNHLEYLKAYEKNCDLPLLQELVSARELHWQRSGSDSLKKALDLDIHDEKQLLEACELLIPWKKGPFNLSFGTLDAEWRSDFKWERFKEALGDIKDKVVLDVGCNNGYFMFQMAQQKPKLVLGIDPIPRCQAQFKLLNNVYKHDFLKYELLGVEHCKHFLKLFDKIVFMGIIYHHRHPLEQLIDLREALKPGGELILETIGIPGSESFALFPEERYAGMKNIYFIPTLSCTINWLKKAKFESVEVIADTDMTTDEQRTTKWNPENFKTLKDSLDAKDPSKTVEGHPSPRRFLVKARRKG
jgi:tRNA (mo5U34)-methyltransferase